MVIEQSSLYSGGASTRPTTSARVSVSFTFAPVAHATSVNLQGTLATPTIICLGAQTFTYAFSYGHFNGHWALALSRTVSPPTALGALAFAGETAMGSY